MKTEGRFNIDPADGFPFSRDGQDFKQGLALMRKVLGAEDAARIEGLIDNPLFGNEIGYLFSKTWGALYARDNLPLRDRALLLMGTDLALGREGPLKDHMRVALHAGVSPQQIVEALFQSMFYVGAPGLVLGLKVASEVLAPHMEAMKQAPAIPQTIKEGTMINDLGVRLGPINHVAMAVKDWEKTARGFASLMGLKTWRKMEIPSAIMENAEYYGKPCEFVWISAFAKLGDTLIELCQPVSGQTIFGDFVQQYGDGMQHVGDLSHPDPLELVRRYTSQGVKIANYGKIAGVAELFFLDTREQLGGMFLEVVAPPTYAQIAALGEDVTFT
jgi:alkylhydroperoxidase/carboxymuconolactone decarboxylase family protein YurZ/catechol 2,3-dioxygenase-like lactoylglutathione lyase family enzyme